jgi:hypothetical protein
MSVQSKRCTACGERSGRKSRRREPTDDSDSPFGDRGDAGPGLALSAYRCGVYSLIPVAGLVLGPIAIVLALLAWREGRRDPDARGNGHVPIALTLGLMTLIFNAAGVALMAMALTGAR